MGNHQTDPSEDPETPRLSHRGLSKRGAKAYQAVLEAVLTVPAGALLGYGVDRFFETDPWGVVGGLLFGFAAFVRAAMSLPKRLAAVKEDEDPEGPPN